MWNIKAVLYESFLYRKNFCKTKIMQKEKFFFFS